MQPQLPSSSPALSAVAVPASATLAPLAARSCSSSTYTDERTHDEPMQDVGKPVAKSRALRTVLDAGSEKLTAAAREVGEGEAAAASQPPGDGLALDDGEGLGAALSDPAGEPEREGDAVDDGDRLGAALGDLTGEPEGDDVRDAAEEGNLVCAALIVAAGEPERDGEGDAVDDGDRL